MRLYVGEKTQQVFFFARAPRHWLRHCRAAHRIPSHVSRCGLLRDESRSFRRKCVRQVRPPPPRAPAPPLALFFSDAPSIIHSSPMSSRSVSRVHRLMSAGPPDAFCAVYMRQVISVKLTYPNDGEKETIEAINSYLPEVKRPRGGAGPLPTAAGFGVFTHVWLGSKKRKCASAP